MLMLAAGDVRTGLEIALPRARVISGRIVDDSGTPLARVNIELLIDGTEARDGLTIPTTDDRGMFRIYGVPSGRYVLCADPRLGASFAVAITKRSQYVRTCYPSAVDRAAAGVLVVANEDVQGVEIRLQKVATYTISGIVLGAMGNPPASTTVSLTRIHTTGSSSTSTPLSADGTFKVSQLVPGTYELSARLGGFEGHLSRPGDPEREWAGVQFEITTADVDGILLQMTRGATLKGRVSLEDPPGDAERRPVEVRAEPIAFRSGGMPTAVPVEASQDGRFTLTGLFGPVVLRASPPRGYVVKSVMYRGREIIDQAVEISGDAAHEAEIVLTNRTSELSGRVLDVQGNPAAEAWILYFPVDPARWKAFSGGIRQRVTTGRYRIAELPAGEYYVAAVRGDQWRIRTEDYEPLSKVAERITITERERRTADLTVVARPEPAKR
jgi:hypothetical protein